MDGTDTGAGVRTALVTGSTDGLGRHVALGLAESGARVLVHGRSAERAAAVVAEINDVAGEERAEAVLADFSRLAEVDRLADEVLARCDRLDLLVSNAGIGSGPSGAGRALSADGVELRFAVNFLAGYRLTRRLLPLLRASAPARVVNVASLGQQAVDFADPMLEHGYSGGRAYAQSKLAQIMSTIDLAEELRDTGVSVNALHPATYMDTTMVREAGIAPWNAVADGAAAVLRLAEGTGSGEFYDGTRRSRADDQAYDARARKRLRELAEELITGAVGEGVA